MAETFSSGVYTDSATGHPYQTTDGLFIPELWTARYLVDLEASLILGSALVTNRTYEGEFSRHGDVLHVPHFVETVEDYGTKKAYGEFASNEMDHAELEYIDVRIQKGSSFRFHTDIIHQLQTQENIDLMSELVRQRARRTAQAVDSLVAQTVIAATLGKDLNSSESKTVPTTLADWNNLTALHDSIETVPPADLTPASDTVYETIVDMDEKLNLVDAPTDRYLIIAPAVKTALLKNPDFKDYSKWGATAVMPTGVIGEILGIPVRVSNILKNASTSSGKKLVKGNHTGAKDIQMFMGATNAVSLLMPFAQMEAYRPEAGFTSAVKSRMFYDAKVVRTEQLVVATDFAAPTV